MRRTQLLWTFCTVICSSVTACSINEFTEGAAQSCESICAKHELCASETDQSECERDCTDDQAWSAEAISAWAECIDELTCDELKTEGLEPDDYPEDCFLMGLSDITLNPSAERFCGGLANAKESCNSTHDENELREECEDFVRGFSDEYVTLLSQCLGESCDSMDDCFAEAADKAKTDTKLGDGIPSLSIEDLESSLGEEVDRSGECPSLSGSWEIAAHCESSVIGDTMSFAQSGCIISQIDPWPDWSGSVDEEGSMIWSGPADEGQTMVCHATLDGASITASCTPECDVVAIRN